MFGRLRRRHGGQGDTVSVAVNGGLLSARVRDENDRPLPGAQVVMRHKRTKQTAHATADDFGSVVTTVAPGTYAVTVSAGGYATTTRTIDVVGGDHAALGVLQLEPDAELRLPDPGVWEIDPDHSSIQFVARHIALSRVHGRFQKFRGSIHVGERMEDSYVEVLIDAASIDTAASKRDEHLRSADFLEVERFPHLHFISDRLRQFRGDKWTVDGNLNMHGTTRSVRLDTSYLGLQSWNGNRLGATATTQLHREDFTINYQQMLAKGLVVIGSTVDIRIDVQAVLKA